MHGIFPCDRWESWTINDMCDLLEFVTLTSLTETCKNLCKRQMIRLLFWWFIGSEKWSYVCETHSFYRLIGHRDQDSIFFEKYNS